MDRNVADMHCDTISELLKLQRQGKECSLRENGLHVDLLRMKESGYLLQNFALFVNIGVCADPWKEVCELRQLYERELAKNEDLIAPAGSFAEIEKNRAAGKMSALLTVEEGAVCGGDVAKLEELYGMGVRMLTLTWNYPNELGYPNLDLNNKMEKDFLFCPDTVHGLTEKGREFVLRMEELGMIADVSHLSDAGFYDVLECGKKPFVASHSNARAVCGCARNLTDDMIRKLAERGGCIGLNFCADFLELTPEMVSGKTPNPGTVESVTRHARHIARVGGIEALGLGSDFDGIDTHAELPGVQSMEYLWEALHRAGFSQRELDRIFGQNVLRVYREVL